MIQTGLESKIKIQQILDNQLPEFVLSDSPDTSEFLKQYYISQEYQGGPVDISDNLSQYLKLDNLTPNVVVDSANTVGITTIGAEIINVTSTKGFPNQYGLLKIGDEIITYTGITTNSFTGCKRGFSGITSYHKELDQGELVFSNTTATLHLNNSSIQNLSSLFLKEFYKKQKFTLTPDLQDVTFDSDVNIGNFIKESSTLYKSKGTDESFRILFNVLYGETPNIVNLENYLLKPSYANYRRRKIIIADVLSGDPTQLVGQTIFKESDLNTNASISEVEPFSRVGIALTDNKQYWKISLFLGYDDSDSTIQGNFIITPSSRCLDTVSIGSSVISVDSTLGFSNSGNLVAGANTAITYTNKSINQFFGCAGIESEIISTTDVRNSDIYFSYENGDTTKKVEMRLTGVLSKFNQISKNIDIDVDQIISVNGLGDNIEQKLTITGDNDYDNMSYKEIFANSWIYNTSVRYELEDIDPNIFVGNNIQTKNKIYESTLKIGDLIEIVKRNSDEVVLGDVFDVTVNSIDRISGNLIISREFSLTSHTQYDIRRKINYAKSNKTPLEYNKIVSDIQNLYIDENDNSSYVASNSLPSGARDNVTNLVNTLNVGIQTAVGAKLSGFNNKNDKYSVIEFDTSVPFINGDEVFYKPISPAQNYAGLDTGNYYVGIVEGTGNKHIKLYASRSFIGDDTYWEFGNVSQKDEKNIHKFTLSSQKIDIIGPQKLFKKLSLESSTNRGTQAETEVGTVGMLINGVEISNYKSSDKIYYGPLDSVDIFNSGSDYDVINPPKIDVSTGLGITALIQPVLSGTITKVAVDTSKFSILKALSVDVTGGNGSASLEASTVLKSRLISFDGRTSKNGGGINTTTNQITFLEDHNLKNAQELIYKSYGNDNITVGIGTSTLVSNVSYYANVINNKTIELYNSKVEALAAITGVDVPITGINTIVFGSSPNYYGVHDFATIPKDTLLIDGIKIIDGGKFTNRKLIVKPIGISTIYDTITFKNHGFNDGEIVEYSTTGTKITGLTTSTGITTTAQQYQILKIDDDSFRLANAGIAGTITSNYITKDYVSLESIGTGYHNFAYPNISVILKYVPVGFGTTTQSVESVVVTPTVKGSIVDSYLYETGTGYGSSILNFEKKPVISIKNGTGASMKPVIINGKVIDINIEFIGKDYYSIPDLNVIDSTGKGTGAELRPVIENNKIVDVKIIQSGIGYSATDTYINVVSRGKNSLINPHIRSLTFDISKKYKTDQLLIEGENKLSYTISGYNEEYRNSFGEITDEASKIIGWAYDGNPIYGSYGYGDPQDANSSAREMISGYELDASNVVDRPSLTDFEEGSFVEDYKFTNSGDLDQNNGRFGKTPEFPNGIYAYFATIGNESGELVPKFPYFIGNSYRSVPIQQDLNQSFDFSSSNLLRNTFPYQLAVKNVDNDFVIESHEISNQKAIVESIKSGPITNLEIISAGDDYKINDSLIFDNTNTGGFGLQSKISSLIGKNIVNVSTSKSNYEDVVFTWDNNKVKINILPHHNWEDGNNIVISGFSTELSVLNGSHVIGFTTSKSNLIESLPSTSVVGVGTEISVSSIPNNVSIGSSLKIGTETLKLLNVYRSQNILRVERGSVGVSHAASSLISFLPDSFIVNKNVSHFESSLNSKVYFNPKQSIGFGTVSGISSSMTFDFANRNITVDVLTQRIYLPNHPFKQDQKIIFDDTGTAVSISTTSDGSLFNMPSTVYVSNMSDSTIGIRTGIGISYSDVYFRFGGADSDLYSFTSDLPQIKGKVERINTLVSLSTSHNLKHNDNVILNVEPNLSVGIGTSTSILVKRQENTNYLLLNPIGFNSTGINTDKNEISFGTISHELKTGDKINYSADLFPEGISSKSYYVYKVDDNTIKLTKTLVDANNNPPTTIGIGSTGGVTQSISLVNPSLHPIKSNDLVFDLTDSSLENYKFKLYYDNEFKNEFISTGSTINNITEVGILGVSTNASLTLHYDTSLPDKLYYNLEKSGFINTSDTSVKNYSEICFDSSKYNSSYNIIDVSDTTFTVPLKQNPEKETYNSSECSVLSYTTKSLTAKGGIDRVSIVDRGNNYSKLPSFVGSSSTQGHGAYVVSKSLDIGSANKVRIINEGFEYSSDVTLKPSAYISPLITIKNSDTIGIITVTSGGENYIYAPFIDIVDSITREKIQTPGVLQVELSDTVIQNIVTLVPPSGMPNTGVELFTTNNSNGVAISSVQSNSTGIFTCWINTPRASEDSPAGFGTQPFAQTDEVYIEGITRVGTEGSGFNSSELGYKFGKVIEYAKAGTMGIPYPNESTSDRVTIDLTGISTNTGIAVTDQQLLSILINKKNYPTFSVTQKSSLFKIGEQLITNNIVRDLVISHSENDFIKVSGTYRLLVNDIIIGKDSGTTATISNITENFGRYDVNSMVEKRIGWSDNIGELNLDTQVLPDNNYYQNLSYSVQSSKTFDELRSPVTSLLHTSGMKNFADVGITTTSTISIGSTSVFSTIQDFVSNVSVETINNFDFAYDLGNFESDVSSSIKLKNKFLQAYNLAKSNEVLLIDSIKNQFSNLDAEPNEYLKLFKLTSDLEFKNLLVRISNLTNSRIQVNNLVILNNGITKTLLNKNDFDSEIDIGEFDLLEDVFGDSYLRFIPKPDAYGYDYDIKTIETKFNSDSTGIGTESIGFVDITGTIGLSTVDIDVGITTTKVIGVDSSKYKSFYVQNQLINQTTNEMNYVELYVTHDETNTYISEYFTDTHGARDGYSDTLMGSFKGDLTGSEFSLQFENTSTDKIKFKSNIVGFGTTSVGVGTYRFAVPDQPVGAERSLIYDTQYNTGVGTTTVYSVNKNLFNACNSLIEVSIGSTKALHQVTTIHTGTNVYTQLGPILSLPDSLPNPQPGIGINPGIGTFGAYSDGSNFVLDFYPDNEFISTEIQVSSFNTLFYTEVDYINTPDIIDLTYGKCTDSTDVYAYNALNGQRINRKNFTLTSKGTPIFGKSFNPSDSSILDLSTGKFNIRNHFFRTNEELIYTPKSTFVGVGSTPMQYKPTLGNIDVLPSRVFAIRNDTDSFYISTTKSGTAVTFTSIGEGNAHEFAMSKSNTKAIISVNNIIQSPLSFIPISYTLENNIDDSNTGISTTRTTFALSGISTIDSNDILKVDDEYMKIVNVGLGTTTIGPITGIGTRNLVEVEREFVGSSATNHTNSTTVNLYRGSYLIDGKEIYFTDAPRGNPQEIKTPSNLSYPSADFNGRVYLRSNYDTNQVYDDISSNFTGVGQTFTLQVGGANTVGLGSTGGNGLVLINNIYQRPTANNNPVNNYEISENLVSGISSITFTGITTNPNLPITINESDVNQNELPRGGLIVSLGSTPGRGYALAEGARVYLEKDNDGVINKIVGIATTGQSNPITTSFYNNQTGILEVITENQHNFESGIVQQVKLVGLEFTCGSTFNVYDANYDYATGDLELTIGEHYLQVGQNVGIATSSLTFICSYGGGGIDTYPRLTDPIAGISTPVTSITNNTITIGVGTPVDSTVGIHTYINGNTVGVHTFVEGASNAITASTGGPFTAQDGTTYNPSTGDLIVYTSTDNTPHNLSISDTIEIADGGITFTCALDNHGTNHAYPRSTDPSSGSVLSITGIGDTTFTVNVGRVGFASDAVIVKSGYSGITTYFFPSNSNVGLGSTSIEYTILDTSPGYYEHKFISADSAAINGSIQPTDANYNAATGDLILTKEYHGLTNGSSITIADNSLTFTCSRDQYKTEHTYPRAGVDPVAVGGGSTTIIRVTTHTFTVNVGKSQTQNRFTTNVGINSIPHTYVGGGFAMPWYGDATYGSGYYGSVSVAVTDIPYAHKFVSGVSTTLYKTNWAGTAYTANYASYNPSSGDLVLEIPSHEMTTSDSVGIRTGSLVFSCSKDDYQSLHYYPRATDPVAGIITDITSYTTDTITVNVSSSVGSGAEITSTVGAGGVLGLSIGDGGTSYNNPQLVIPEASYDNLSVIGVSRLSVGATTDTGTGLLLNVEVGASSTVGVASTYFEVTKWEIARDGYAFNKGDVFTPVGLVTDANLASPQSQFQLTVLDTYRDAFSAWQFGQMDYIDSIKSLQDGERTRFPLRYDNELLSFESEENGDFPTINLTNALLIIINGVLQDPNDAYIFNGGNSFIFKEPPAPEDDVSIFFYKGTAGEDSVTISDVFPTLKRGDIVQLDKISNDKIDQDNRVMSDIVSVDTIDTVLYRGLGITDEEKTLNWTKQKHDKIVGGNVVSKSRLSLESLIFPTTKIIGKLTKSDNTIFVSDAKFFEEDGSASSEPISGLIVDKDITPVAASITANVSSAGTISSLTIVNGGVGYTAAPSISIGIPSTGISIGIGTTATATTTISAAGTVNSASIVNPGLGYTSTNSPQVLVLPPAPITETITNINSISGFSGIITGISTTIVGVSTLGVSFFLSKTGNDWTDFNVGNPVYISNTTIGSGVISIDNTGSDSSVVGIGTTFLDNIYIIQYFDNTLNTGIITCLVSSGTVGIATSMGTKPLGEFSWGKFAGIVRDSNPIAIAVTGKTINSGLTTFPTIQRRGVGIRNSGALDEYYS